MNYLTLLRSLSTEKVIGESSLPPKLPEPGFVGFVGTRGGPKNNSQDSLPGLIPDLTAALESSCLHDFRYALTLGRLQICGNCLHFTAGQEPNPAGHCTHYDADTEPFIPFDCPAYCPGDKPLAPAYMPHSTTQRDFP